MRGKRLVVAAVTLVLVMPLANANHRVVSDGSSEPGRLDIKKVWLSGETFPKWKIRTYSRWTRKIIVDQGFLTVYLDTFGSERHDYFALVWADKDKVRGTLMRDRKNRSDYAVSSLRVVKLDRKTVEVRVPLKKVHIGKSRTTYNWYVQTLWNAKGCEHICFDWAPNSGRNQRGIDEPLPPSV